MNRRELLLGLAAGGTVIAGELWFPGKKLISIPKRESYTWTELFGPRYYPRTPFYGVSITELLKSIQQTRNKELHQMLDEGLFTNIQ